MSSILQYSMNKKNLIIIGIFTLLLIPLVYASAIASIGMQGLGMVNPEAEQIVSNLVCVSNPIGCAQGKVIGMVQSEALQSLAKQSPEIAQAVMTYNQIQGYVDAGAEITQELQVDETGQISEGIIQFNEKEGRFGNLIGKDIEQKEIYGKEIELNKKNGISTISFTGENSYINVKGDLFKDVKASGEDTKAYLKLNEEGDIKEADITASKDTSFVFGEKRIDVKEGTRVFYQNGKITINGKEGEEVNLMDKVTDENGDYSFSDSKNIKILDSEGRLSIEGNTIRGTDFQIGNLRVKAQSIADLGEVSIVPEGYLLGKKSIGEWKGMNLITDKNVLLATSKNGLENYDSWILPDTKRLQAKGEGFEILFNEDNEWAKVDSNDNFAIRAGKNFRMDLENRNIITNERLGGLIPKMSVSGDFAINQDYKSIYTKNNKLMVKRDGTIFNSGADEYDSTSPIELLIKNSEGNFNQEKYIVSNFKGIATVPLEATEGISDERYANSIYQIRAKIDNRYNYPTIEDFESISGKQVEFLGDELNQPEYVRALIDIYKSNPKNSFEGTKTIKIFGGDSYENFQKERSASVTSLGFFIAEQDTIVLKGNPSFYQGHLKTTGETLSQYEIIIHEAGHGFHYDKTLLNERLELEDEIEFYKEAINSGARSGFKTSEGVPVEEGYSAKIEELIKQKAELEKQIIPIDSEWEETLNIPYDKIDFVLKYEKDTQLSQFWDFNNEEIKKISEKLSGKKDFPYGGYVRSYGASNLREDIATYREKVIGDPGYFRRYGLLDSSEGNLMYDPAYKQKIDLLLKYGFITDKEYDAVFHPEKYGL